MRGQLACSFEVASRPGPIAAATKFGGDSKVEPSRFLVNIQISDGVADLVVGHLDRTGANPVADAVVLAV